MLGSASVTMVIWDRIQSRPINHMLAGTPREQAIMICDDEDRGNQAVPPPDGYSDEGDSY